MKNTTVKPFKRSRTFQQHPYGPVWAANKHSNSATLLGSGANSVITSSGNVASCPIALNPVSHCHQRLSCRE